MDKTEVIALQKRAAKIRMHIINSTYACNSGHPGGALSSADVLAVLFFHTMRIDPAQPQMADRDRFVMSKGHSAPGYYGALAERGFFPVAELEGLRSCGSFLQGHPDMRKVPGVDMSTGSLGMGLSAANGMAMVAKYDQRSYRVYCILGDGEIEEGQIWEAAMTAAHYKLDNVIAFLDNNDLQIDGRIGAVMSPYPIREKFEAFGWQVLPIDGNDIPAIGEAIDRAQATKGRPTLILCQTVKGKGVSFMEDQVGWHGKAPNQEQRDLAISELEAVVERLEAECNG